MSDKTKAIRLSLLSINLCGFTFEKQTIFQKLRMYWFTFLTSFVGLLAVLNLPKDNNDLVVIARKYQSIMLISLAWCRKFTFLYYKKDIKEVLEDMKQFWTLKGIPEKEHEDIKRYERLALLCCYVFFVVGGSYVLVLILKFFFTSNPELTIDNIILEEYYLSFKVVYLIQTTFFANLFFFAVGFDNLFVAICGQMIVQLKILCYKLRHYDFENDDNLVDLIQYHKFLIAIIKKMTKVYSVLLLWELFKTTCLLCMLLYMCTASDLNASFFLQYGIVTFGIITEFTVYCIPATELCYQASQISTAVYDSKWYYASPEIQKLLILMLLKSQKEMYFTAKGITAINRMTYTNVFKTSFSFFAVMRTLKDS